MSTTIGRNLSALITDKNITQSAIAAVSGASDSAVSLWLSGRNTPRQKYLQAIADYYSVPLDDLLSDSHGYYAMVNNLVDAIPGALAPSDARKAYAPLYGRVHAGKATDADILDARIPVPFEVRERHPRGYFLEVEGDCMNKIYTDRSYIYIDPDIEPRDGSIAVFKFENEYLVRRLHKGARALILSPESTNETWDDIIVQGDTVVSFVGTVVWHQSKEELT